MSLPNEPADDRVLVLTPFGRDAEMVREQLGRVGMACEVCSTLEVLLASMRVSAGAALVAQEALVNGGAEVFLTALEDQEPWSDFPVLLLAGAPRGSRARGPKTLGMFERANVTVLERPITVSLLVGSLRAALRARGRQYETRDLLQELKRAIELGDMFVSILGHDLRTPLGAIRMSAEVMLESNEPRALRASGRILRSADRMTQMIEQLLDLARARQSKGMAIDPSPVALDVITHPIVEELEVTHPMAKIELVERGELAGTWDADLLGRVISNLVGNAVKHGTPGTPITVELDGTLGDVVRCRVANAGAIPAEAILELFEPFKRTRPAHSGERGLGLGLFIAREIVIAHGGDIVLLATAGDMTVFEISLPRHAGRREGAAP